MAATTTLLGLLTPTQGTLSGTWGDSVNYGISDYLDIAIAGTLTLTGDGAITLANTTGSSSGNAITSTTAQYMVIRITGTQTVTKVITGPSYSKLYMVDHAGATSAVTFKASGQTGVSIAVGEKCFVYYNGTDYVKIATSTSGTGSVTSVAATVPSIFSIAGSPITTSGTLAMTYSGTALPTANGGTNLTSFTSGGVVYASSSSALATGSALTFDGTTPTSSNAIGSPNFIFNSSANTPYIRFDQSGSAKLTIGASAIVAGGAGYDFYGTAGIGFTFYTNASRRLDITSAGDVGIGTSSPVVKLDVIGKIRTAPSSGAAEVAVRSPSGSSNFISWSEASVADRAAIGFANGSGNLQFRMGGYDMSTGTQSMTLDSSGNLGLGGTPSASSLPTIQSAYGITIGNNEAHTTKNAYYNSGWKYATTTTAARFSVGEGGSDFRFYTASSGTAGNAISFTQAMTLDASGNLGIGTTSPANRFTVADNSASAMIYGTQSGAGDLFALANSASEKFRITNAGNVGIGTSSPNRLLSLYATQPVFQITNVASGNTQGTIQYQVSGSTDFILDNQGSGSGGVIAFMQAGVERMRITSAGNVGIGLTSPGYKLQVAGSSNQISIQNTGYGAYLFDVTSGVALAFTKEGTGERARITPNGGFSVGTTADPGAGAIYATGNITAYYSDARLKTVSGKIENALDKVAQLSGVYYTNNSVAKSFGYDSDEVQVGVLAQDVEAVLPQIVKAAPFDLDQDGNSKSGENYKTVQYERLVPLLIEAINELQAKVKALEAK